MGCYRSWSLNEFIFDHMLAVLQLEPCKHKPHYPFKFSHLWLEEDELKDIIRDKSLTFEVGLVFFKYGAYDSEVEIY